MQKFFQKLQPFLCGMGTIIMIGLPVAAMAVTIKIDSPQNGVVIQSDNTLVTGIASALGNGQGIDLALVLDDSGSLSETDPTRERFEATRQLVNSFGPNANVYIEMIFFTSSASVGVSLQPVSTASSAINGAILSHQNPGGGTDIGAGIKLATQELATKGRANTSKVILVFTDGGDSSSPEQAAQEAFSQGYIVHVVGLPSTERPVADAIVREGGGKFFLATQPHQLAPLFRAAQVVDIAEVKVTNLTMGVPAGRVNLSTGNFTAPVDLILGENVLQAIAIDTNGIEATDSVTVTVEPICPDDTNPVCPCPNLSNPNCPKKRVKALPQVIMAGFDPMLIDFGDDEIAFNIMAIVREGIAPIRHVTMLENTQALNSIASTKMTLQGQLENGDKVYSIKYVMDRENAYTLRGEPLSNLFGSKKGEYQITAIDEDQAIYSFPDLIFGNNPDVPVALLTNVQANPYTKKGIRRSRPQVIMAGMDPIILDISDDSFKLKAIVRPGRVSIQHVRLKQNKVAHFSIAMTEEGDIGNGDIMYSTEFAFERGSFEAGSIRDLFGSQDFEFVVEAVDVAQQKHAFPALEVCGGRGCPELSP